MCMGTGRKAHEVEKLNGKDREGEPYRYSKNGRGGDGSKTNGVSRGR